MHFVLFVHISIWANFPENMISSQSQVSWNWMREEKNILCERTMMEHATCMKNHCYYYHILLRAYFIQIVCEFLVITSFQLFWAVIIFFSFFRLQQHIYIHLSVPNRAVYVKCSCKKCDFSDFFASFLFRLHLLNECRITQHVIFCIISTWSWSFILRLYNHSGLNWPK